MCITGCKQKRNECVCMFESLWIFNTQQRKNTKPLVNGHYDRI